VKARREDVERGAAQPARVEPGEHGVGSTSSPRAQLTTRAPSFIAAIASASIRSIVSGVFGTCSV
jgi:hypothetical protein